MPGIFGLITKKPRPEAERDLQRMLELTRHEPSYVSGTWTDEDQGVYVGWTLRAGSFGERMPIQNERRSVSLVFAGEDFSPELAQSLRAKGHALDPDGPSYVVHLYEEDSTFPAGLNGRFQGLLTDRVRGVTMLFTDRFGMQRLYFHETADGFYFASEAKAILAIHPHLRRLNQRALGELVACGCVLENRTLFEGLQVMPGAAAWIFRRGGVTQKETYFDPKRWEEQGTLEPEPYFHALCDVFSSCVSKDFEASAPIGVSLTGGLDTRMIMAFCEAAPGTLPCYSFGGAQRESQDVMIARRLATAVAQPYQVIAVDDRFLSRFPSYAERTVYLTDGCSGVDRSPDLFVSERARAIASIRMTGNYGGEVMRRVRAFKPASPLPGLFHPDLMPLIEQAQHTYAALVQCHPLSFSVFRQAPWHHFGLLALEETQLTVRTPFIDNEFVRTVYRAPESATRSADVSLRLIAAGNSSLMKIRTDRGLAGNQGPVLAAAMSRLLEFTFKAEYAYDQGMPHWLARVDSWLAAFRLERLFLGKHKFTHFRTWYRNPLSAYVREMLLDSKSLARPYIQRRKVERVVTGHLAGDENYTTELHQLLTLELAHRLFIDG